MLGNIFGLASALGGMRRKVWAWPVGIVGNLLLLTVFLGNVFGAATPATLWGQAGRQVMFIAVAVYGWHRWKQGRERRRREHRRRTPMGQQPDPARSWSPRMVAGTVALTPLFDCLGLLPAGVGRRLDLRRDRCWPPTAWPAAGPSSG